MSRHTSPTALCSPDLHRDDQAQVVMEMLEADSRNQWRRTWQRTVGTTREGESVDEVDVDEVSPMAMVLVDAIGTSERGVPDDGEQLVAVSMLGCTPCRRRTGETTTGGASSESCRLKTAKKD